MLKNVLAAMVTLSVLVGSTAFATDDSSGVCKGKKVVGSYVRQRPNFEIIDQLTLNSDGTAYWYQSTAFDFLVTGGSFIPQTGSWTCTDDGSVVVTTIGTAYRSTGADLVKDTNGRLTERLSVIDNDTLLPTHRQFRDFALTDDPRGPNGFNVRGCSPATGGCPANTYQRIKPIISDVP